MVLNQKGDLLLYLIFTISLLLIGAILYYVFLTPNETTDSTKNQLFTSDFKPKISSIKSQPTTNYEKKYPIYAELVLDIQLELQNKDLKIKGAPNIIINGHNLTITNPTLLGFSGIIEKKGITGYVDKIISEGIANMEIGTEISSSFENISQILVKDVYLDLESTNINGMIKIQDKNEYLNKVYLKIGGFKGNITIDTKKDTIYAKMDGNVGTLKIIDGIKEITIK